MKIDKFKGDNEFLSNFYLKLIIIDNIEYASVEHYYQSSRAKYKEDRERIRLIPKPGKAKREGRAVPQVENWKKGKSVSVMKRGLIEKFKDKELRLMLFKTGNAELIEGNDWHDNFFGDCYCEKCKDKEGLNILGKLLMEIRSTISVEEFED